MRYLPQDPIYGIHFDLNEDLVKHMEIQIPRKWVVSGVKQGMTRCIDMNQDEKIQLKQAVQKISEILHLRMERVDAHGKTRLFIFDAHVCRCESHCLDSFIKGNTINPVAGYGKLGGCDSFHGCFYQ